MGKSCNQVQPLEKNSAISGSEPTNTRKNNQIIRSCFKSLINRVAGEIENRALKPVHVFESVIVLD
jgi:hypothetical protein